jgi:hypothetical protein
MNLQIVNSDFSRPPPPLIEPRQSGYLYIAAATHPGNATVVLPDSARARLLSKLKRLARELERADEVSQVTVFRAVVRPPTARFSRYLQRRGITLHRADYDVMVLIETASPASARSFRETPAYAQVMSLVGEYTQSIYVMAARNGRRIADVPLDSNGLFLFNHFAADDAGVMAQLWDRLAGWYVAETGLRNSVALFPLDGEPTDYQIVNWAEWNTGPLRHFWAQLSKRGFWKYVAANLEANQSASMPIYCRLVA